MLTAVVLASVLGQAGFNLVMPLQISETNEINFGDIVNTPSLSCTVTMTKRSGSSCLSSDWRAGSFHIIGGAGDQVSVTLSSVYDNDLSFKPLLSNGIQNQIYDLKDGELDIPIGGELTLNEPLNSGKHIINYTIDITYH